VVVAHDGETAIRTFPEAHPEVAILDIGMPGMDGYELARRIRALHEGQEVLLVAVTGWGQAKDRAESCVAGFDHHLTKPVEPERLLQLVARMPRTIAATG